MRVLVAALLLVSVASAYSQSPKRGSNRTNKADTAQTQQCDPESLPATINLLESDNAKKKTTNDSARIAEEDGIAESNLIWMRVASVGTALLALFALLTWREIQKASQRQLRAYVHIDKAILRFPASADHPSTVIAIIGVKYRNFGQTPAFAVKHAMKFTVGSWALDSTKSTASDVLGPNVSDWKERALGQVTSEQMAEIDAGKARVVVEGRFDYRNIFGQDCWTEYCYVMEGYRTTKFGSQRPALVACDHGNRSDDAPKEKKTKNRRPDSATDCHPPRTV